jgi:predicted flap endonuclease-1-like 5' DNA nuclease
MQEFFMDYGLWLLIALLVIIGIVFLLSGRSKPAEPPAPVDVRPVAAPVAAPAVVPVEPVAAPPVEPIAVEPEPLMAPPAPQPIPTSPAVAAPVDGADDLLRLKGVGPKLSSLLTELGVTRYAQIAGWNEADIAAIDARLGNFKGRPVRDQWVDQAKYLAAGDIAGFEAKYGKI